MANQPERVSVRVSDAMLQQAFELFGPDRSANGQPSFADFESFFLPTLVGALAVLWMSAQDVPGYEGLVRELITKPHRVFGPARVTAMLDGEEVVIIGFEPDLDFWSS